MNLPDLVHQHLGDEQVTANVHLGGDDRVYVTPTRTLVYRAEGLLSDESVTEFGHDVDRLAVASGRRKDTFELEYVDRTESFTVPGKRTDDILQPLLAGILAAAGVMDADETLAAAYRFSELTLVITSKRLVKHVGQAVWDAEFDDYLFDELTGLSFEDGSVATTIVLSRAGRPERIKCPNEKARLVRQTLESELFDYYDVPTLEAFNAQVAPDEQEPTHESIEDDFEESGLKPLGSGRAEAAETESESPDDQRQVTAMFGDREAESDESPPTEVAAPAADADDVQAQLEALTAAVEQQSALLEQQQALIEQLIDELSRGR
ncbi:hypothetical protein [Haladaptatus sp. DYSN1]|uniref:DUF7115 domain-containing protein n=1 Tax=unclassified Haladaptatus TaxID=2622732 RepID=UPI002406809E|nr:hypothetical protein [Haladaptatus sp. DYSN1]